MGPTRVLRCWRSQHFVGRCGVPELPSSKLEVRWRTQRSDPVVIVGLGLDPWLNVVLVFVEDSPLFELWLVHVEVHVEACVGRDP